MTLKHNRKNLLRVHVFFDGQNLFGAARDAYGYLYPNYDPVKLAHLVTERISGRKLEGIHFYTGIHNKEKDFFWHEFWTRKLRAMGRKGVHVFTRELRYSAEKPREKGIDVRLALDIVRLARKNEYDVAIIFSQDAVLEEAVDEVISIQRETKRHIHLESAFPFVTKKQRYSRGLNKTDWIRITKEMYDQCIDSRDYRPKK